MLKPIQYRTSIYRFHGALLLADGGLQGHPLRHRGAVHWRYGEGHEPKQYW